jgi:hypothetical protein
MIENLKRLVTEAEEIASSAKSPELKQEAFRIILSKMIENGLGSSGSSSESLSSSPTSDFGSNQNVDGELPVISPTKSTMNNIRELFNTEWGKKRRTVAEINKALDANGVPDPKHTSTMLGRLVDAKELLRIKQDEVFVYWRNPATG